MCMRSSFVVSIYRKIYVMRQKVINYVVMLFSGHLFGVVRHPSGVLITSQLFVYPFVVILPTFSFVSAPLSVMSIVCPEGLSIFNSYRCCVTDAIGHSAHSFAFLLFVVLLPLNVLVADCPIWRIELCISNEWYIHVQRNSPFRRYLNIWTFKSPNPLFVPWINRFVD